MEVCAHLLEAQGNAQALHQLGIGALIILGRAAGGPKLHRIVLSNRARKAEAVSGCHSWGMLMLPRLFHLKNGGFFIQSENRCIRYGVGKGTRVSCGLRVFPKRDGFLVLMVWVLVTGGRTFGVK